MERKGTKWQNRTKNSWENMIKLHKSTKIKWESERCGGQGGKDAILRPIGYPSSRGTYPSKRILPDQHSAKPRVSIRVTYPSGRLSHSRPNPRGGPSGRFRHKIWNRRKICKKIYFPKNSYRTRMYNLLKTQSNSISKICKNIIES